MEVYQLPDPLFTRDCYHPDDWDDAATIGKHLKRRGKSFIELGSDDYAIFLGNNTVGIKDFPNYNIKQEVHYESNKAMHADWILD